MGKIQPCQTLVTVQIAPKTAVVAGTDDKMMSEPIQRSGTRVKDKKNPDSMNVKQRELRQLEIKLKKWEEDLKMQEARTLPTGDGGKKCRARGYNQNLTAKNLYAGERNSYINLYSWANKYKPLGL